MRALILICIAMAGVAIPGKAQVKERTVGLQVGDTVYFGPCEGNNYEYIDLYSKTRFEASDLTYDSTTGDGFYQYFFGTGDFDVKRLPCQYANTPAVITSITAVSDDKGNEKLVIFATIKHEEKVAWIEAERAFDSGEVEYRLR